jgi:hypothetical protein
MYGKNRKGDRTKMPIETVNCQDIHQAQQLLKLQQTSKSKFLLLNPIKRQGNSKQTSKQQMHDDNLAKKKPCESYNNDDQQKYYSFNKNNERTVFKQYHSSFLIMPDSVMEKHDRDAIMLQTYLTEKNSLLNEIDNTKFDRNCLNESINSINKFLVKYYMLMNEHYDLNTDLAYFKNLREKILKELSNCDIQKPLASPVSSSSSSNSPSPSSSSSTLSAHELNINLITFGKLKQQQQQHQAYQQSIVVNHQSSPILKKTSNPKQMKTVTFNNNISLITQFDENEDADSVESDGNDQVDEVSSNNNNYDDDDDGHIIDRLMKKIHFEKNYQKPNDAVSGNKICELCFQTNVLSEINDKYCENCFYYMKTNFNLQN